MVGNNSFQTDKASDGFLSATAIRNIALVTGQEVTYTSVPLNTGLRLGIDRDDDTILDSDDNCPANYNPQQEDDNFNNIGNICEPSDFDSDGIIDALDNCPMLANENQLDTDTDGLGDACDADDDNDGLSDDFENSIGTNSLLVDSDGDTLSDFDEVNYDGNANTYTPGSDLNPLLMDSDNDGFNDDIELIAGSNPLDNLSTPADGDINQDGSVNVIDLLLATQIALGLKAPTVNEMLHGDVAPLNAGAPNPDGVFNAADLLLIQRKVFGLVSF